MRIFHDHNRIIRFGKLLEILFTNLWQKSIHAIRHKYDCTIISMRNKDTQSWHYARSSSNFQLMNTTMVCGHPQAILMFFALDCNHIFAYCLAFSSLSTLPFSDESERNGRKGEWPPPPLPHALQIVATEIVIFCHIDIDADRPCLLPNQKQSVECSLDIFLDSLIPCTVFDPSYLWYRAASPYKAARLLCHHHRQGEYGWRLGLISNKFVIKMLRYVTHKIYF